MSDKQYMIIVDDEVALLETYRQYLTPKVQGSALGKLRALKKKPDDAEGDAQPANKGQVLPDNWELLTLNSGEAAIAKADELVQEGGEIGVAIFDVKMPPGIDGISTMLEILKRFPRMRCAVISAYNDRNVDDINALFDPAHRNQWDFMSKPFTEQEIRQKVRTLCASWQHQDAERRARAELEKMNANLHELVEERTRDLRASQEQLAASEARMRQELTAAADIQLRLFPSVWPSSDKLNCTGKIEPAEETGGDLAGYLLASETEYGFYVCDVTGHGAGAALGTAILHTTLREAERQAKRGEATPDEEGFLLNPADLLRRLNVAIREGTQGSLFATCFIAVLDIERGLMRYASAGHEWPLMWRGNETKLLPLYGSPPLGHQEAPEFVNLRSEFEAGDALLMYSDGLTDTHGDSKPLHRGRLFKAFAKAPKNDATQIEEAIVTAFRQLVPEGTTLDDDVTYLILHRSPLPGAGG